MKKVKKVETKYTPFEERKELKKLVFYVVIVNFGQGDNIVRILKANHSTAQFIQAGEGTATNKIRDILNIDDNRKEVIYTLIREDYISDLQKNKLIEIKVIKNYKNISEEFIYLDFFYEKISLNIVNEENSVDVSDEKDEIFDILQKEVGLQLSFVEVEIVKAWKDSNYSDEIITLQQSQNI